jgi:threonine/homoserine efflux transporter RhtA
MAVVGTLVLNEHRNWARLAGIGLIIMGVVGLKAFARASVAPPTAEAVSRPPE